MGSCSEPDLLRCAPAANPLAACGREGYLCVSCLGSGYLLVARGRNEMNSGDGTPRVVGAFRSTVPCAGAAS